MNKIQRQGASYALIKITELQGTKLEKKIPVLWNYLYTVVKEMDSYLEGKIIHIFLFLQCCI